MSERRESTAPAKPDVAPSPTRDDSARAPTLEITLTVSPRRVSAVRRFVEEVAERLGADADLSARMAMTAHELLENVAKYGEDRRGVLRLEAAPGDGPCKLMLTVVNQASPDRIDRLKQAFRGMDSGPDPFAYYVTLMSSAVPDGESGLGLARIRAEGDMHLSLSITRNEVSILATSGPFAPLEETG